MAVKKLSPRQAAKQRITAAKKALAAGAKGASGKLDKAISAYAKAACRLKSTKGAKRKQVSASVGKKRKTAVGRKKTASKKK